MSALRAATGWRSPISGPRGFATAAAPGPRVPWERSLQAVAPEVAAQWHLTKNGDVTPSDVVAGSGRKYWFKCDVHWDHEWEATLNSRVSGGHGCPCCAGQQLSETNCLATVAPEVAVQWHPTWNGEVTPSDVVANSHRKCWFKCDEHWDHEWEARLDDRVSGGTGCPCCVNRKASETNSLASLKPAAAARWHPTKNGDLTSDDVVAIRGAATSFSLSPVLGYTEKPYDRV